MLLQIFSQEKSFIHPSNFSKCLLYARNVLNLGNTEMNKTDFFPSNSSS